MNPTGSRTSQNQARLLPPPTPSIPEKRGEAPGGGEGYEERQPRPNPKHPKEHGPLDMGNGKVGPKKGEDGEGGGEEEEAWGDNPSFFTKALLCHHRMDGRWW